MSISNIISLCYFKLFSIHNESSLMQFKILEKYFQFELHTSESQDCSVQASQRLVSKKLYIEEQIQVEGYKKKKQKEKYII